MKWRDYEEGVLNCPDEELHTQFGIYDNFSILARAPFEKIISLIGDVGYTLENTSSNGKLFSRTAQGAFVRACPIVSPFDCGFIEPRKPEELGLLKWMQKNYQTCYTLTPKDSFIFTSLGHQLREISQAVLSIGETLQSKDISFCLPRTRWTNNSEYNKIVYYPDSDEEEMCKQ